WGSSPRPPRCRSGGWSTPRLGREPLEERRRARVGECTCRIRSEEEARERSRACRKRRREKYRSAKRNVARIDGDGAARRERNAKRGAETARRVRERQLAEKHEARVLVEELLETLRIRRRPGLDCRHRSFAELEFTALDEVAPDRLKRMAVLVGIAQTQGLAAIELD